MRRVSFLRCAPVLAGLLVLPGTVGCGKKKSAAAAPTASPVAPVVAGPGTITGRVTLAETGAPAVGAEVRLFDNRLTSIAGPAELPATTSDAEGNFSFPGLEPTAYTVLFWSAARQHQAMSAPAVEKLVVPAGGTAVANFSLQPLRRLTVRVNELPPAPPQPNDPPAPVLAPSLGTEVFYRTAARPPIPGLPWREISSGAETPAQIPVLPGEVTISLDPSFGDAPQQIVATVPADLKAAAGTVTLEKPAPATLLGRVSTVENGMIADFTVAVVYQGTPPGTVEPIEHGGWTRRDGSFQISGLRGGRRFRVFAYAPGLEPVESEIFRVDAKLPSRLELKLKPAAREHVLVTSATTGLDRQLFQLPPPQGRLWLRTPSAVWVRCAPSWNISTGRDGTLSCQMHEGDRFLLEAWVPAETRFVTDPLTVRTPTPFQIPSLRLDQLNYTWRPQLVRDQLLPPTDLDRRGRLPQ